MIVRFYLVHVSTILLLSFGYALTLVLWFCVLVLTVVLDFVHWLLTAYPDCFAHLLHN
jgi:hypothetical protein